MTKKFYKICPWANNFSFPKEENCSAEKNIFEIKKQNPGPSAYKTIKLKNVRNKLECLSVASISHIA